MTLSKKMSKKQRINNNRKKIVRADPVIQPRSIKISGRDIPSYVAAPTVMRVVRLVFNLTSGTPILSVAYANIAAQDALNYTGASSPVRYKQVRAVSVKAWAETPNSLSVSQAPYGLILTDYFTGFAVQDRAVTGARVNACGLAFPFYVRSVFVPTSSASILFSISSDGTIAASTDFTVTCDICVEFQ
jgi:hypothetical protein